MLSDQHPNDRKIPNDIYCQLVVCPIIGSTKTDAKNTCPTSFSTSLIVSFLFLVMKNMATTNIC